MGNYTAEAHEILSLIDDVDDPEAKALLRNALNLVQSQPKLDLSEVANINEVDIFASVISHSSDRRHH